jgi:hypothetical protein
VSKIANLIIDVGRSSTKYSVNGKIGSFVSSIMEAPRFGTIVSPNCFKYKESSYLIGKDNYSNTKNTKTNVFVKDYMPLLVYKILKDENLLDVDINIDFSISFLYRDIEKELYNSLKEFEVNGEVIKPKSVKHFYQGEKAFLELAKENPELKDKDVFTVDIGYYSIDIAHIMDGTAHFADTQKLGVSLLIDRVKGLIETSLDNSFTEFEVVQIVKTREVNIFGDKISLLDELNSQIDSQIDIYISKLKELLKSEPRYKPYIKGANTIVLFCGGGAYLLEKSNIKFPANTKSLADEFINVK